MLSSAVQAIVASIPVIAGFLVGFASDPVKSFIARRIKRQQIKFALYSEIVAIQSELELYIELKEKGITHDLEALMFLSSEAYELAKTDLLVSCSLKEWSLISAFYRNIRIFTTRAKELDQKLSIELASEVLKTAEILLNRKGFDKKLLKKVTRNAAFKS